MQRRSVRYASICGSSKSVDPTAQHCKRTMACLQQIERCKCWNNDKGEGVDLLAAGGDRWHNS